MRSVAIGVIFVALFASRAAAVETTEWMAGTEAIMLAPKLDGKLLLSIKCRDTPAIGLNVGNLEYKISYSENPKKIKFLWAVGSHYGPFERKAQKEGYRRVSFDQFVRPSGLKIRCGVWHKE